MVVFRVDGNFEIGAGHIMRCLSIANRAKDMGETCLFIVSSEDFQDIILDNGHQVKNLKSDYSNMKLGDILSTLETYNPSAVFVDSYYVSENYLQDLQVSCKEYGGKLIYVDDRCKVPYCCDILLNYNIFGKIEDYKKVYARKMEPIFLLGPSYAPLRREFQSNNKRDITLKAKNIFVSTGGSDLEHLTIDIVEEAMERVDYIFHFVVGMMNPDKKQISKITQEKANIVIHENVQRMDELMRTCDVAISAAGFTLYELCATQTPSITYVLADNQIPAAEEFDIRGIMKNCGDIRAVGNNALAKRLVEEAVLLAENYKERKRISKLMASVVDGMGASRILEKVLN